MKGDGGQARLHQQWLSPRKPGLEEPGGQKQSFCIYIVCRVFFLDALPILSLFYVSSASEDIFKKFLRPAFRGDVCCLSHSGAQELKAGLGKQQALISKTSFFFFFSFLGATQRRCTIRKHSQSSFRYVYRTSACVCSPHLLQPDLVQMPPRHLIGSPYLDSR